VAAAGEKQSGVAQVWADALLTLAAESGREDELLVELDALVELLERRPDLAELLASPAVADAAKRELIERTFRGRASDLLVDALQVLREKRRLGLVHAVRRAYRAAWLVLKRRVEVRVTSAVPLGGDARRQLERAAALRSGREPILIERVDPALIGGLVVAIGDDKFDASVASDLARLQRDLLARGSVELIAGKSYFTDTTESPEGEAAP
jgi:F-type H+-transporting ATPase subunit delta